MGMPRARDEYFFFAYSIICLVIVFAGFAPSFFLQVAFDRPSIPLYLHLHGAILTGWFVWLVAQTWLIRVNNRRLHMKLGYYGAAYGLLVVAGGLMATVNVVSRELSQGLTFDVDMAEVDPAMGAGISYLAFISKVVWANIASVVTFSVLLYFAVINRSNSAAHKRLILVATVSILGPPLARLARLELLGGEQGPFVPLALLTLLLSILAYDLLTLGKFHKASLLAVTFAIALKFSAMAIAGSEFGREFVRHLA